MYELDAIEAINIDQLVTATDRLLLRCTRTIHRPGSRSTIDFSREAAAALAASEKRRAATAPFEETVHMREPRRHRDVFSAAVLIASAWLGVVCACLLA